MIVDVLARVAIADAVAGVLIALAIYFTGNRPERRVSIRQAVALALFFGLPAALLYAAAWSFSQASD